MSDNATRAAGSSEPDCWPLPPEWDQFIPPQAVVIREREFDPPGCKSTCPEWNEEWLRGLESYVRSIVRDELSKANASLHLRETRP